MELVQRVDDTAAPMRLQVQVDHRSSNITVPQQFLDSVQIGAGIQQMRSEGVAKGVGTETLALKACLLHGKFYIELDAARVHALALLLSFE